MLHFTGIHKALYDFQNISSLYWKRLTLPSQLSLGGTDATGVNVILRQDLASQGCILIQHNIGVNISERKSGTERTKKRKKRELVCFPHRQGAHRNKSPIDQCNRGLHGFCTSYDNPGYIYPGPYAVRTKSQLKATI